MAIGNSLGTFGIFDYHSVHSCVHLVHFYGFGIMHQTNLATLVLCRFHEIGARSLCCDSKQNKKKMTRLRKPRRFLQPIKNTHIHKTGWPDEFVKNPAKMYLAQTMFCQNQYMYTYLWKNTVKKWPNNFRFLCNFPRNVQSKQPPKRRKFAQSGHPASGCQKSENWEILYKYLQLCCIYYSNFMFQGNVTIKPLSGIPLH
jgi:hypothetical protein